VITLNPTFYGDANISEAGLQNTIILSETDITTNFCPSPVADKQRIKGTITASLQDGDVGVEKTITVTPALPGYRLSAPIYVYVCLTNKSGGEFLYKTWSFVMRDGKFQKVPDQPLLLVTDGIFLIDNTIVDAMGNVTIFWKKRVRSAPPNDSLTTDEYYTRRFNASTGSWSDPSVSPISNNPPTNLYNPIPLTRRGASRPSGVMVTIIIQAGTPTARGHNQILTNPCF